MFLHLRTEAEKMDRAAEKARKKAEAADTKDRLNNRLLSGANS